jgi:hypothetical protein
MHYTKEEIYKKDKKYKKYKKYDDNYMYESGQVVSIASSSSDEFSDEELLVMP